MNKKFIFVFLMALPLLVSCGRKNEDPVLATVGERKITRSELISAYGKLSGTERPDPADPEARTRLLRDLINKDLLESAAYEHQPELDAGQRRRLHRFAEGQLLSLLMKREVQDKVKIPEDDVKDVWNRMDREIKARHILIEQDGVLDEVKAALAQGTPFEQLVSKSADVRSAENGGDLGWVTAGQMVEPFDHALFASEIGKVTGPVTTRFGTHYIVVDSIRSAEKPPYESVRDKLELGLLQQRSLARQEDFQNEMLDEASPENQTPAVLLINEKFYFEVPPERANDPYAMLNEQRQIPTFTTEQLAMPVVKFGDRPDLKISDFIEMLSWMAPGIWPKGSGVPEVEDVIRQMLRTKLHREKAMKMGLDKDPEYVAVVKKKENEVRVNTLYYQTIVAKIALTEDDYRNFFEKNRANYRIVERSRQARIETRDEALAKKVAEMWKGGRSWAEVEAMARRQDRDLVSVESTPEMPRNDEDPLERDLYAGGAGQVVGPVFVPAGPAGPEGAPREAHWVVAQALEINPERQMTYEEAKTHVLEAAKAEASETALRTFLEGLEAKHPVKINQKELDAITPAMMNGETKAAA